MMTSYFNLLKYAQAGIASPDMTYYDKMRASTLMGGVVQSLTGQPPLTFKADGTPLISWSMKGNGSQTGTPTPDNPVMPEFVGVRTGNLFDKDKAPSQIYITDSVQRIGVEIPLGAGTYSLSGGSSVSYCKVKYGGTYGTPFSTNAHRTLELPESGSILVYAANEGDYSGTQGIMLNSGSTALPYEPFGYKIPISCGGQTVPVYLGQVSTVRRIRKRVFDGSTTINDYAGSETGVGFVAQAQGMLGSRTLGRSTHFRTQSTGVGSKDDGVTYGINNTSLYFTFSANSVNAYNLSDLASIKQYLADQYAAGTPVTVWYVLATPETGITNEPLCKIGDFADELHSEDASVTIPTIKGQNTLTVETELQPSEMTITYKG